MMLEGVAWRKESREKNTVVGRVGQQHPKGSKIFFLKKEREGKNP